MLKLKLILALVMPCIIGAALWGVNWHLDHPPLSDADKEFQAVVAGADSVGLSQFSCQKQMACAASGTLHYKTLNAAQTRALIADLRFADGQGAPNDSILVGQTVTLDLVFRHRGADLGVYSLCQTPRSSALTHVRAGKLDANYRLRPRFDLKLRRFLEWAVPQRITP